MNPVQSRKTEVMGVIMYPWFLKGLLRFLVPCWRTSRNAFGFFQFSGKRTLSSKMETGEENEGISLLGLPDLALEGILERLSPDGLCSMSAVCSSLRGRCTSDHLWEKHLKEKWGGLMGDAAHREWQCYCASRKRSKFLGCTKKNGIFGSFPFLGSLVGGRSEVDGSGRHGNVSLPLDSVMSLFMALETGKFWFPAQVYNRENGHVGFMLSCYDAEVSYDSNLGTFRARYPAPGRRTVEENIDWSRLRAPAVDTPAYVLHTSDCLHDLRPDDHIEIQWRRNKEFPYGWWYGVVGHLESCNGNQLYCQCNTSDMVVLEFKQYAPGSRWRQTLVNRKDHHEVGNEADGFYGGIRKLYNENEISMWKGLWPTCILE